MFNSLYHKFPAWSVSEGREYEMSPVECSGEPCDLEHLAIPSHKSQQSQSERSCCQPQMTENLNPCGNHIQMGGGVFWGEELSLTDSNSISPRLYISHNTYVHSSYLNTVFSFSKAVWYLFVSLKSAHRLTDHCLTLPKLWFSFDL